MTLKLERSRYNHLFKVAVEHGSPGEERRLGFQGRSGALVELEEDTWNILHRGVPEEPDSADLADLKEAGFLVPENEDETLSLRHLYYQTNYGPCVLNVVIAPTLECNMACSYCFESGRQETRMTPETALGVTRTVTERLEGFRALRVTWYGGEPLLASDIMNSLSDRLRSEAVKARAIYQAHIVTNGTLLTPATSAGLREMGVGTAQVTLDGTAALHDSRKPLRNGAPTWERIVDNLGSAAEFLEVVVRATVGPGETPHLLPLCEALDRRGIPPAIVVRPAPLNSAALDGAASCGSSECRDDFLLTELVQAGFYRDHSGHPRLELPGPDIKAGCLASSAWSFAIDPAGDIHRCLETVGEARWAVGNVTLEESGPGRGAIGGSQWLRADPFLEDGCFDCPYLPQCFGGCPRAFLATGRRQCTPWRKNLHGWAASMAGCRSPAGVEVGYT